MIIAGRTFLLKVFTIANTNPPRKPSISAPLPKLAVQAPAPEVAEPSFNIREMLEEILIKQDMIMRMLINNKIEIGNEQSINVKQSE